MSHADPAVHLAAPAPHASAMAIAQRYLGLALSFDYLSSGHGHRQTRRVIGERMAHRGVTALPDCTLPAAKSRPAKRGCDFADSQERYLWEVACQPRLSSSEEYRLAVRMRAGDREAHDALLQANLGLVVMFARRYQRPGVPMLDLVAEGNMGLLTAARRFDPELGHRFATYAKWWVRQAIQLALPRLMGVVRLPASHHAARRSAAALRREQMAAMPLEAELNAAEFEDERSMHDESFLSPNPRLDQAANDPQPCGVFDFEPSDAQALDALAIPTEDEPPAAAMALQRMAALWRALDSLNERDRVVISERYALVNDRACTLDELARRFNVSIERIRQIECAAVKKLAKALKEAGASADTLL
ncbi:MAG: sigma-70 family RNA polymerase sigma factor [Methylibium sp.]|uniref:sigma-70 family RNA polymerase sigma factor n=1 Tax=Methylibium sp. TaxID=2067992 RepID=UPI0017D991C1|nr:sigma-70 family RNA polymerase sigma factor [Methylibium sp.]MBA3596398.1 sigma-70 family RNA polymerase sigma factor [Methylibium sp.]